MVDVNTISFVGFMIVVLVLSIGLPWLGHRQDVDEESDTDTDTT